MTDEYERKQVHAHLLVWAATLNRCTMLLSADSREQWQIERSVLYVKVVTESGTPCRGLLQRLRASPSSLSYLSISRTSE